MAKSNFYIDYTDGEPSIHMDEIIYFDESINDWNGYISALEEVSGTQEHVLVQIESSVEILTSLKADERCEWIEDVSGWPVEEQPE